MIWSCGIACSQDLGERVLALADAGSAVGQDARRLCVSVSYVSNVLSRPRITGETAARSQRSHVPLERGGLHAAIAARSLPVRTPRSTNRAIGCQRRTR